MLIYFYGSLDSKKIEDIFSENIGNFIQTNFSFFCGTKIFEFLQLTIYTVNQWQVYLLLLAHKNRSILYSLWVRTNWDWNLAANMFIIRPSYVKVGWGNGPDQLWTQKALQKIGKLGRAALWKFRLQYLRCFGQFPATSIFSLPKWYETQKFFWFHFNCNF